MNQNADLFSFLLFVFYFEVKKVISNLFCPRWCILCSVTGEHSGKNPPAHCSRGDGFLHVDVLYHTSEVCNVTLWAGQWSILIVIYLVNLLLLIVCGFMDNLSTSSSKKKKKYHTEAHESLPETIKSHSIMLWQQVAPCRKCGVFPVGSCSAEAAESDVSDGVNTHSSTA